MVLRDDLWNWERYVWDYEKLSRVLEGVVEGRSHTTKDIESLIFPHSSARPTTFKKELKVLQKLKLLFEENALDLSLAEYYDEFTPGVCGNPIDSDEDIDS